MGFAFLGMLLGAFVDAEKNPIRGFSWLYGTLIGLVLDISSCIWLFCALS